MSHSLKIKTVSHQILYELWYSMAETIFERVCLVTELDKEQIQALRTVTMRPNDFHIIIDQAEKEEEKEKEKEKEEKEEEKE